MRRWFGTTSDCPRRCGLPSPRRSSSWSARRRPRVRRTPGGLGDIDLETETGGRVIAVATLALAVSVFPLVGVGAWAAATVLGDTRLSVWTVTAVAVTTGVVLAVLSVAVAATTTYAAYRLELDPDDIAIPVVTNLCDVLGIVVLGGVIGLV